ncbi:MAG: helix-turn-helix domain-containing protein [Halanaerobiales bacterium]|nr:helix-turn-helix domain-containing protein [Halanaerobiales bacterium]
MRGKVLEVKNSTDALKVMKALASEARMQILDILSKNERNLSDIAEKLAMPSPSVTVNIKKLEEAGLIETEYQPGSHGSQKICRRAYDSILINFPGANLELSGNIIEIAMPIGNYKDFNVSPTCGIATEKGYIGILDDNRSFLEPEHIYAQLLWFREGYVQYRFPNNLPGNAFLQKIEISMEICSEAPHYNKNWPSDITLWINEQEVGSWTSPADFGETKGKLNPVWWNDDQTQYGLLKIWYVNEEASYIDGKKISDLTVDHLDIIGNEYIDVKIGIKEDARNKGGINIFGRKFGNYEQDIIMRLRYNYQD